MKLWHVAASLLLAGSCCAADLTENWLVAIPNADGTARKTYLNLKHDRSRITGTIRVTQFFCDHGKHRRAGRIHSGCDDALRK